MARKIPDALISHAAKLVEGGSKLKDAALAVGYTADELSKRLRTMGVKVDQRRDWNAFAPEIIRLYQSGLGTTAIATAIGAPRHSAGNVRDVLIRNGIMRSRSDANITRFAAEAPEVRKGIIRKARSVRMQNLFAAAKEGVDHAAIGFGERETADILHSAGFDIRHQVIVEDNYLIDIAIGNIAIEVKTNAVSANIATHNGERFEKLAKRGYVIVFLVVNHIPTLTHHADDLIAIIKIIQASPTASGQYWVIRCALQQIGTNIDVDHWSVERRSPKRHDITA